MLRIVEPLKPDIMFKNRKKKRERKQKIKKKCAYPKFIDGGRNGKQILNLKKDAYSLKHVSIKIWTRRVSLWSTENFEWQVCSEYLQFTLIGSIYN